MQWVIVVSAAVLFFALPSVRADSNPLSFEKQYECHQEYPNAEFKAFVAAEKLLCGEGGRFDVVAGQCDCPVGYSLARGDALPRCQRATSPVPSSPPASSLSPSAIPSKTGTESELPLPSATPTGAVPSSSPATGLLMGETRPITDLDAKLEENVGFVKREDTVGVAVNFYDDDWQTYARTFSLSEGSEELEAQSDGVVLSSEDDQEDVGVALIGSTDMLISFSSDGSLEIQGFNMSTGKKSFKPFQVAEGSRITPASLSNGNSALLYVDTVGTLWGKIISPDLSVLDTYAVEFLPAHDDDVPGMVAEGLDNGNYVGVWVKAGQLRGACFHPRSATFDVSSSEMSYDDGEFAVGRLQNGGFVVVWEHSSGITSRLRYRVYNSDCAPVTDELRVSANPSSLQRFPLVSQMGSSFVLAWVESSVSSSRSWRFRSDSDDAGSTYTMWAQRFQVSDGGATSDAYQLETSSSVLQPSDLLEIGEEQLLLGWTASDSSRSSQALMATLSFSRV